MKEKKTLFECGWCGCRRKLIRQEEISGVALIMPWHKDRRGDPCPRSSKVVRWIQPATEEITDGTMTKERPILMSGEMVRAILEGRKTQTRRIAKIPLGWSVPPARVDGGFLNRFGMDETERIKIPYGQPGDRLWVKETFVECKKCQCFDYAFGLNARHICKYCGCALGKLTPSIFMRRNLSRFTLEIVSVRVERLHEIGWDGRHAKDVLAEGITDSQIQHWRKWLHPDDAPAHTYGVLWESINGKGSWAKNPMVWVIGFKRIKP